MAEQREAPLWRSCPLELRKSMPQLQGEELRPIAAAYKQRAGIGGCTWHPRHWSWLSAPALECLAGIRMLCELCGTWPTIVRFLLLMLVGKDDGGGRPIALQCSLQRVYEGARDPLFAAWDRTYARPYDYAGRGRAGHKAVWRSMLEDEAYDGTGLVSTTVLTDLAKAYEKVKLNLLWLLAVATGMPQVVVMLALENYYGMRYFRIDSAYSMGVRTMRGLVAGSKFANRFLKLMLVMPLDWLLLTWNRLSVVLYVDDIKLKLVGTPREALVIIPQATRQLIHWLEAIMDMVVSRDTATETGKSGFLCSCRQAAQQLLPAMQEVGLHLEDSKKWLGIDYQPSSNKPKQPTRNARLRKARRNWRKVGPHHRKFGRGGVVVRQGHCASLAYGAACLGTPKAISQYVTAKTRATQPGAGCFRSGRLGSILHGCRRLAQLTLAPVKAWAEEAWDEPDQQSTQAKAWGRQIPKLRALATIGMDAVWQGVKGPACATWATIRELGGSMTGPFEIDIVGVTTRMQDTCPHELMQELEEVHDANMMQQWAAEDGREVLLPQPWMLPAQQLINRKLSKTWTKRHRNLVRLAVTGGFPEQQALYEGGGASRQPNVSVVRGGGWDPTTCLLEVLSPELRSGAS